MLRLDGQQGGGKAFYGEFARGDPLVGAIETGDGILFGRFKDGEILNSSTRHRSVEAFRAAAKGARAASDWFATQGRRDSANFYAGKAAQLENALD